MVEDVLAARGVIVSHQTVRLWAVKFGRHFAKENPEAIDRQARRQMAVGYRTNMIHSYISKRSTLTAERCFRSTP